MSIRGAVQQAIKGFNIMVVLPFKERLLTLIQNPSMMKHIRLIFLALFIGQAFLVSCTKSDLAKNNSPVDSTIIAGFRDSTLLIKRISLAMYDTTLQNLTDSLSYYYLYDTATRRVTIFLHQPLSASDPDYLAILDHDNTGLLTKVTLSPAYYTDPDDITTVAYAYDAQHVIKSEIITYKDRLENIFLNKTTLPGGAYALDWHRAVADGDSSANVIRFNANGKVNYFSSLSLLYAPGTGYIDSLVYDANGSIIKQTETHIDGSYDTTSYDLYSYTKDTRGNQFYNSIETLYHGIAGFPLGLGDQFSDPYNYLDQETIYPATQTIVHHLDEFNNPYFVNFQSPSQFDASNRLVQTTLFADDIKVYPVIMKIDYYK
jgi:hypothetical protein